MTSNVAVARLAGLATLFFLIELEIRSQARGEEPPPARPSINLDAFARVAVLVGLIAAPFAALGLLLGVAGVVAALALAAAAALWSLWQTGPAVLAQCGARSV